MSFNISDIQSVLAETMFSGDISLAGMAIFTAILIVMFAAFGKKNILLPFAALVPMTVMFSAMGIVPSAMAIILTLISVLVIAAKAREAF